MVSSILANTGAVGEVGGISFTGTTSQSGAHQRYLTSAKTSSEGLTAGEQMALQGFTLRCKSVVFCVFVCVLLYTELFYYLLT